MSTRSRWCPYKDIPIISSRIRRPSHFHLYLLPNTHEYSEAYYKSRYPNAWRWIWPIMRRLRIDQLRRESHASPVNVSMQRTDELSRLEGLNGMKGDRCPMIPVCALWRFWSKHMAGRNETESPCGYEKQCSPIIGMDEYDTLIQKAIDDGRVFYDPETKAVVLRHYSITTEETDTAFSDRSYPAE